MQILKKISVAIIGFCSMGLLFAQTPTNDLVTLLNQTRTMQADFVQTSYDNNQKAIQKSYGKMSLSRPGKFRWQIAKPIPQLIIANGARLWIYDADLEQLTIKRLSKTAGEAPALLLSQTEGTLDKDFIVTAEASSPTKQTFKLVARAKDSMFSPIFLGFNNKQITEMRLQDGLDHTTVIQFNNIQTNLALNDGLFKVKTPANVDIIDETQKQ